jgi:hypothetical protein
MSSELIVGVGQAAAPRRSTSVEAREISIEAVYMLVPVPPSIVSHRCSIVEGGKREGCQPQSVGEGP